MSLQVKNNTRNWVLKRTLGVLTIYEVESGKKIHMVTLKMIVLQNTGHFQLVFLNITNKIPIPSFSSESPFKIEKLDVSQPM